MASFLKKAVGGKADIYVDQVVDQAAVAAKGKVKSFLGNNANEKKGKEAGGSSSGGGGSSGIPEGFSFTPREQPQNKEAGGAGGAGTAGGSGDITDDLLNIAGELANEK